MDMQGTPIGSTNQGMKNTSDPERYSNPTEEGAGAVTSDSLAAESARSGGAFSANRDSDPLSVDSGSSTLANTDTSAATTLGPAPDAAEREAKAAWQETSDDIKGPGGVKYAEGTGGQGDFPGQHNADGYAGGPTSAKQQVSSQSSGDTKGTSSADPAPGYTGSYVSDPAQSGKPKGKNITEGGFDSDPSNNASFSTDIGTDNDPGRAALAGIQRQNAESGPDAGGGPRSKGVSGDGQYDTLETDQSL
ncbi:hypothetical protein MMC20_005670 [Loxospora ochrophaea]|nr:hypothetical protein [Loxospora ochrophaea]